MAGISVVTQPVDPVALFSKELSGFSNTDESAPSTLLTEAVYLVSILFRSTHKLLVKVLRNGSHPISHSIGAKNISKPPKGRFCKF